MAGPLNGIGGQSQLPIATAFRPGEDSSQQVRQPTQEQQQAAPQDNTVQPQGTQAAGVQNAENNNTNVGAQPDSFPAEQALAEARENSGGGRGSLIDITV